MPRISILSRTQKLHGRVQVLSSYSAKRHITFLWLNDLNHQDRQIEYDTKMNKFENKYPYLANKIHEEDMIDFILYVDAEFKKPLQPWQRVVMRQKIVNAVRTLKYDDDVFELLLRFLDEWKALDVVDNEEEVAKKN